MAFKISSLIFFGTVSYILLKNVAAIPQGQGNVIKFLIKKYEISNFLLIKSKVQGKVFRVDQRRQFLRH